MATDIQRKTLGSVLQQVFESTYYVPQNRHRLRQIGTWKLSFHQKWLFSGYLDVSSIYICILLFPLRFLMDFPPPSTSSLQRTGAEVVVVTLPGVRGAEKDRREVKRFATRLFNSWGLGDRRKNNGVLLLVSTGDRRVEVEIGRGLNQVGYGGYGERWWKAPKEMLSFGGIVCD